MSGEPMPRSSLILYQTEDGRTRIQCRFENNTIWLTQAQIAELFETTPKNITLHLKGIFDEGELTEGATCKDYLQVRSEGGREVSRQLRHYRLEAILAVGFRVRNHRGTKFRQWATARLSKYLVKGFTMDDEQLKNPPGPHLYRRRSLSHSPKVRMSLMAPATVRKGVLRSGRCNFAMNGGACDSRNRMSFGAARTKLAASSGWLRWPT